MKYEMFDEVTVLINWMKSGNNRSKSLRTLVESDRYPAIKWGSKYARANVGFENNILTMPYSTAFLLHRVLT